MAEQKPIIKNCDKVHVEFEKPTSPCKTFPLFKYENPCRNIYLTKKQKKQKRREAALNAKNAEAQKDALTLRCKEINKNKLEKNKHKRKKGSEDEQNDEKGKSKSEDSKKTENSNEVNHGDEQVEGDEEANEAPYDKKYLQANINTEIEIKPKQKRKFGPGDYKYVPSILRDKTIVRKCNDSTLTKRLAYSDLIKEIPPKPLTLDTSPDYYRRMDERKTTHCFYSDINYPDKIWKRHLPRLPRLIGVDKHHLQCFLNPNDTLYKYMEKLYPCVKEKEPCLCCCCQQKLKKSPCFPCRIKYEN